MQKTGNKINLALDTDVKKVISSYFTSTDNANVSYKNAISSLRDAIAKYEIVNSNTNQFDSLLSKVNAAAKDLGISPNDLQMSKDLNLAISDAKEFNADLGKLQKALSTIL